MPVASGEHHFVARVHVGASAAGISTAGSSVRLEIEGTSPVDATIALYSTGDIKALDPTAITRVVPRPGTSDFEPNLFAAIELAHPALPWMLSPSANPWLPWLVLVVVEDQSGVSMTSSLLTIAVPASIERELPDLRQSWAWVHAHGVGAAGATISQASFGHSAEPTYARILCPRRLTPRTRYHAALVPTFARGVQAALGEEPTALLAELAWTDATELPLQLPVYHAWSFTTGDGGDFASLARRLRPRTTATARSAVDASDPGWGVPSQPGRTVVVGGVLEPVDAEPIVPSQDAIDLGASVGDQIDAAAETPILPAPAYGSFATGAARLADAPAWMQRVNHDVRLRIAAGLGAEVVRRKQEELVDAVWRRLGEAEAANQLLRQAELAAALSKRLFARHLDTIESDAELLHVVRPAHRRFRIADGERAATIDAEVAETALPTRGATATFRRLARPGARIARRSGTRLAGPLVDRVNRDAIRVAPPRQVPDGIAALDVISKAEQIQPRYSSARPQEIDESATFWKSATVTRTMARRAVDADLARRPEIPEGEEDWSPGPISETEEPDPVEIDEFAAASQRHQRYLLEHLGRIPVPRSPRPFGQGSLTPLRARLHAAAAPPVALAPLIAQQVNGHVPVPSDPFASIALAPILERPMLPELRALDLAQVFPGLGETPPDTVALLEPDHEVVWSFLLGVNHELAAELAWRACPIVRDATVIRSFWGRTVRDADERLAAAPDIPPISEWPAEGPPAPPVAMVLLIRGDLLRTYPNAIVYLVEANWRGAHRVVGGGAQRSPLFRMALTTDAVAFGFDLSREAAEGAERPGPAGWYVVIEEHPQEPRFGLGAELEAAPLASWSELRWSNVTDDDLRGGTHLVVDGPLAALSPAAGGGLAWGRDSAQQAAITLRRPTRIAIHASLLLRPPPPPPA